MAPAQVEAVGDACAGGLARSRVYSSISPLYRIASIRSVPTVFLCALCGINCFFFCLPFIRAPLYLPIDVPTRCLLSDAHVIGDSTTVQQPRRGGRCGCREGHVRESGCRHYGADSMKGLVFRADCSSTLIERVRRFRVLCSAAPHQLTPLLSLALLRQPISPLSVTKEPSTEPSPPVAPLPPRAVPQTPVQASTSDPPPCDAITPALPVPPDVPLSSSSPGADGSAPTPTAICTVNHFLAVCQAAGTSSNGLKTALLKRLAEHNARAPGPAPRQGDWSGATQVRVGNTAAGASATPASWPQLAPAFS